MIPRLLVRIPTIAFMVVNTMATTREEAAAISFSLDDFTCRSALARSPNGVGGEESRG
jgi:hypothetical protein